MMYTGLVEKTRIFEDANVELSEENDVAEHGKIEKKKMNLFILFFY